VLPKLSQETLAEMVGTTQAIQARVSKLAILICRRLCALLVHLLTEIAERL
jgi:hypothetical protein